jgi:ATP-binding cassette subfamily F protein 3
MRRGRGLEVAYFAQHQLDKLRPGDTPLEHVIPLMPYDSEARRRSRVARMGLSTSRMDTPAKNLSGGERARLLLGLITFGGPGMLILDEPTNHLDIDSRDALVAALNEYEGAVLIISHDRHLIDATCETLWIAADGTVKEFDDDLDGYQRMLTSPNSSRAAGAGGKEERKAQRQEAAQKREQLAPLRKSIKDEEGAIERLKGQRLAIERSLGDPAIYNGDPKKVIALGKDKARIESEIAAAEERWLMLSAEYEGAQQAMA